MAKKPKKDLFDTSPKVTDIYSKEQQRWTPDDYIQAMEGLSDAKMAFLVCFQRRMLMSPAFRSLSPRASKLLVLCWNNTWMEPSGDRRSIGKHGRGKVYEAEPFHCPYNLAIAFGVGSRKQISEAFRELKSFGFLDQVGVSKRNSPNVYKRSTRWESLTADDINKIRQDLKSKTQISDSNSNLEHLFKVAI